MSTSVRLKTNYKSASGDDVNLSYNHAKSDLSSRTVKNLMDVVVQNGDIFLLVPTTKASGQLVTTTTVDLDIEDE